MTNLLKQELKRAFTGKWFMLALTIGLLISISHFVVQTTTTIAIPEDIIKPMLSPSVLLASWMGGNNYNLQGYLLYLLLPLLATMPYAYSYHQDKKLGYLKNILTRTKPINYYISKWIGVFLSAGTIIIIPLILNLLLFMTVYPTMKPQPAAGYYAIIDSSLMADLFYHQPLQYILFYLLLAFVFAGLIGTIGLVIEFFTEYLFIVLLSPFLIYIFTASILEMMRLEHYSPNNFLRPSYGKGNLVIILIEAIIIFSLTFIPFIFHGKKRLDY